MYGVRNCSIVPVAVTERLFHGKLGVGGSSLSSSCPRPMNSVNSVAGLRDWERKKEINKERKKERAGRARARSCAMDGLLGSCPPLVFVLGSVAGPCPLLVLLLSLSWPRP